MPEPTPALAGVIVVAAILLMVGISVSFKGSIHF